MKVTVLGGGSWGTALACHLSRNSHSVCLWTAHQEVAAEINSKQTNKKYFPEEVLEKFSANTDLGEACDESELVVYALPAKCIKQTLSSLDSSLPIIITSKGIVPETGWTASDLLSGRDFAVLSGPSFAREVLRGKPTAVTLASTKDKMLELGTEAFHSSRFRIYSSSDVTGVELGGILKNIYAIAAGVVDGLDLGPNARAALVSRSLVEMSRLIESEGGKFETVYGLSGLGDLVLTASDNLSRNRRLGLALARGATAEQAEAELGQVAEGRHSVSRVLERAKVEMPIAEQVQAIISGSSSPQEALDELFSREQKSE